MRPTISPAPPCSAVDQWMMSPPSATWTPPCPSSFRVLSAIVLTCLTSTSPAPWRNWICANVIRPSFETGAPCANGSPTESTAGDFLISPIAFSICGRWLAASTLPSVDGEDDAGGVARLLREAVLQQVVRPLGLGPGQAEVVDVVTGRSTPEHCGEQEGCDPEAQHGTATVVAPRGELAHGANLKSRPASVATDTRTPDRVVPRAMRAVARSTPAPSPPVRARPTRRRTARAPCPAPRSRPRARPC